MWSIGKRDRLMWIGQSGKAREMKYPDTWSMETGMGPGVWMATNLARLLLK